MTHIPTIESINAWCPNCQLHFGFVVQDREIVCPGCQTVQKLPIIFTGSTNFYCLDCHVSFDAPLGIVPTCHECHAKKLD